MKDATKVFIGIWGLIGIVFITIYDIAGFDPTAIGGWIAIGLFILMFGFMFCEAYGKDSQS